MREAEEFVHLLQQALGQIVSEPLLLPTWLSVQRRPERLQARMEELRFLLDQTDLS